MAYVHSAYHGGKNYSEQVTDEHLTCRICRVPGFRDPRILSCGHTFCKSCIQGFIQTHSLTFLPCPLCGKPCSIPCGGLEGLRRNIFVDTQVDRLIRRHNNALGRDNSFYNITKYY